MPGITSMASDSERTVDGLVPTRIYLVRHGRTALNAAGVLRGHLDPPLDDVGQEQARRLGAVLGRRDVTVVVASPLRRAVQTAEAIAAVAGLSVVVDARLIDRDLGRWAGVCMGAVEARWGSLDAAPGVESADQGRSRARDALEDLARMVPGKVAAAVSHDAVNRLSLTAFDPDLGDPDKLSQDTGCVNTLEQVRGRWAVVSVNVVAADEVAADEVRGRRRPRRPAPVHLLERPGRPSRGQPDGARTTG